jgi:hypothetical protein
MPAGVALPTVRRSMMRRIEFFGAEPGNNPDNWKSYEAPAGSDRIAPAYRSSVFASPGGFVSGEVKF